MKKIVFKVTYPNGKIHIGTDETYCVDYFGTPSPKTQIEIEEDFNDEARRDFTLRKEILWESDSASIADMRSKERELIKKNRSHNPAVGYNRTIKWHG